MKQPNYRVNPSLLNAYQDLLNSERVYDKYYGQSENPSITLEEFEKKQEQDLIDAINRTETVPAEAPTRGTCLNEIIDCILEHRKAQDGFEIHSVRGPEGNLQHITASHDGFTFNFDGALCMELASYFRGSICQHLCEATIDTSFGPVIVYGYLDYLRRDVVFDLKTTGRYEWGKYEDGWQKVVYPWALIESGEVTSISGFEYTAVKVYGGNQKNPIVNGEVYHEWYDYDHNKATNDLREVLDSLIAWVERHRSEITHPRIFNK